MSKMVTNVSYLRSLASIAIIEQYLNNFPCKHFIQNNETPNCNKNWILFSTKAVFDLKLIYCCFLQEVASLRGFRQE